MSNFPRDIFIFEAKKANHSAEFIANALSYIDKLEDKHVPVIFSIPHLAIEVGMQSDFINYLINTKDNHYSFFLLQKKDKNSAPREIMAPNEELKFLQRWININILQKLEYNSHIHGFIPESSILKHAQIHHKSKYLMKIDLLKFFDTITDQRVYNMFRSIGYTKNLAWDFSKICTAKHRTSYWESFSTEDYSTLSQHINCNPNVLPQGAPTSPLLANLVATHLDVRIGGLAKKMNFKYTRYADDLCFSSDKAKDLPSLDFVTKIIQEEGFFVNKNKVKYSKTGMKQYVTGLVISNPNAISVSKKKRREIFSHLYYANKYGIESHILKLKSKGAKFSNFQNWLLGNISFHYSIDKKIGKKMFNLYNKINWSISIDSNEIKDENNE